MCMSYVRVTVATYNAFFIQMIWEEDDAGHTR